METRMTRIAFIVALIFFVSDYVHAQEWMVRRGNELYMQGRYAEAAQAYQQALQKKPTFTPGTFNLGNALVQQKQYDAARKVMANAAKTTKDPAIKSGANYNVGNTYMSEQQWQQAVDAYKESLRKNPQDADAKYNLSYALAKLRKEQQQGGGGGDDDKNKDNKEGKDQKDQQQKEDKKGKQEQDQSEADNQQHQQQRPQPQQSKISAQQADNLLKALQQDERKVQDKMQQGKATPVKLEKDW